ncbi:MAG: AroM family protein [Alphaproteobacteria bacterium]|nr:AroM family protein [Alphaproteobacteria bacterium]
MGKPTLAALVVGQSPRPDIEHEIALATGNAVDLVLRGALDGLSRAEIDALPPENDGDALFTRLPDGSGVRVSKAAVVRHGTRQLEILAASGHDVAMVLCTGEFPEWMGRFRVVFPSRVLAASVRALLPRGRLGILTPLPEQIAGQAAHWQEGGHAVEVAALSPNASAAEAAEAGARLAGARPDLLVFDCMSYTSAIKRAACAAARTRGVLAISACARLAAEIAS